MTSSTEQTKKSSPLRIKHQWIGAATLVALAALVLPWLLTPRFASIRESGPQLARLPDPPAVSTELIAAPSINQKTMQASEERLQSILASPVGPEGNASFILQVGAFKNYDNAKSLQNKLIALQLGRVYLRAEKLLTLVYVGPLLVRTSAEAAVASIQAKLSLKAQIKQYDVREHGQL